MIFQKVDAHCMKNTEVIKINLYAPLFIIYIN
jgi:hypothetical protein